MAKIASEGGTEGAMNVPSGLTKHGILTLPLGLMLPFGLLGFRPGQIWKPLFGYVMIFIPIFNYIITLLITINYFIVKKNYNDASNIFFAVFVVFISIKLTWLMYIFYKGYNLFNLIEDIHKNKEEETWKKGINLYLYHFDRNTECYYIYDKAFFWNCCQCV